MLVMNRREPEEIVISNDIIIRVVRIKGDSVRIGIEAPKSVRVNRREVYNAILRARDADATKANAMERQNKRMPRNTDDEPTWHEARPVRK